MSFALSSSSSSSGDSRERFRVVLAPLFFPSLVFFFLLLEETRENARVTTLMIADDVVDDVAILSGGFPSCEKLRARRNLILPDYKLGVGFISFRYSKLRLPPACGSSPDHRLAIYGLRVARAVFSPAASSHAIGRLLFDARAT